MDTSLSNFGHRFELSRRARSKDAAVELRLKALAAENNKWDCPQLHEQLRREEFVINHKRTERLYRKWA